MTVLRTIARNLRPSRILSPSHAKRAVHIAAVWTFKHLVSMTRSPVEFRFGPNPHISVGGVLLDYDVRRAGDVLSMDVDGPWEPNDLAFVLDCLRTGGTFYDIGANLGWYSLNVALKSPATVICFEPQPERLFKNLSLNGVEGRVFAVALGSEHGITHMTQEHKAAN